VSGPGPGGGPAAHGGAGGPADDEARSVALIDALYRERGPDDGEREPELASLDRVRALHRALPEEEAPPAASAKLLAAAAEAARARQAPAGWAARLRRWFEPLLASPGLAAAASLILVVGVAGVLISRGMDEVAQPAASPALATAPTAAAVPDVAAAGREERESIPAPAGAPGDEEAEGGGVGGVARGALGGTKGEAAPGGDAPAAVASSPGRTRPIKERNKAEIAPGGDAPAAVASSPGRTRPTKQSKKAEIAPAAKASAATRADEASSPARQETLASPAAPALAEDAAEGDGEDAPASGAAGAGAAPASRVVPPDVARLHEEARAAAKRGDCVAMREAIARIRRLDRRYFAARVSGDRALATCATAK
jgi:hypothetical protein